MATIGNWNGHTFVVGPSLIRGFTELSISGSCETTTKNSNKQKYEERKYGESPVISMTVSLNAQAGVTDVYSEAMAFVKEATKGACAYFYLGGSKVIPAKCILTKADITEVVTMPGKGNVWISCDVKLTLKQGSKNDGGSSGGGSSGGGGSNKASVKTSNTKKTISLPVAAGITSSFVSMGLNCVKAVISAAKQASSKRSIGLEAQKEYLKDKQSTIRRNTAIKTGATTGRLSTSQSMR